MSEAERLFLEVRGLKKSFGSGDTRQDVLRGLDFSVSKGTTLRIYTHTQEGRSALL